jgi:hypothetical protein
MHSLEETSAFSNAEEDEDDCWASCKQFVFRDSQTQKPTTSASSSSSQEKEQDQEQEQSKNVSGSGPGMNSKACEIDK